MISTERWYGVFILSMLLAAVVLLGIMFNIIWLLLSVFLMGGVGVACMRVAKYSRALGVQALQERLYILVFCFVAFSSLLLSVLIPPQQSPDETAHFGRAYSLLNNEVLIKRLEGRANQHMDEGFHEYDRVWSSSLPFKPDNQVTREMQEQARALKWHDKELEYYNPAAVYFPSLYLPASLGIGLAKWLQQPPWVAASWARFGMWFIAILSMGLALSIIQVGRCFMAAVMVLPMTLAQIGSSNLDSITISGTFLLISIYTWQLSSHAIKAPQNIRRWGEGASWLLLLLLAMAKPVFLVLLLLPLYIYEGRRERKWRGWGVGAMIVFMVLAWQLHVSYNFENPNPSVQEAPLSRLFEALTSPLDTINLFFHTFNEKILFYWESMVGILGWLDTPLPKGAYILAGGLLFISLISDMMGPARIDSSAKLVLGLVFLSYVVGVMLMLWVAWTPVGSKVIEGVQGRYFLPLLPVMGVVLAGMLSSKFSASSLYKKVVVVFFIIYMVSFTVDIPSLLIYRYWL
ncbi:DUF2142 domain-containing protein [Lysobacter pythonis]|uniref:DUF2142 domain-containing protein n=1 Tax=Solilutibacter pythonis TaxID=2483112 RepID=A0A3M2I2C3_9GAMM|nr:DUF2142 domain-containing protein [Lysobacter pythonis]RMH93342.1 DUF2142 domain-containing protein [Lysobacter pythonis]